MSTTNLSQFLPASGGVWAHPSPQGFDYPSGDQVGDFSDERSHFIPWLKAKAPSVQLEMYRKALDPNSDPVAVEWALRTKDGQKRKRSGKPIIPPPPKGSLKPYKYDEYEHAILMEFNVGHEFFRRLVRWNVADNFQWCAVEGSPYSSNEEKYDPPPCWPDSQFRDMTGREQIGYTLDPVDAILVPVFRSRAPKPEDEPNYSHRSAREKLVRWFFATGRRNFLFSIVFDSEGATDKNKGMLVHLFYDQSPTWPFAEGELSRSITLDLSTDLGLDSLWSFLWRISLATKYELGVANAEDSVTNMDQVEGVPWARVKPSCYDRI